LKIPPCLPLPAFGREKIPKGGDISFPLWKSLPAGRQGGLPPAHRASGPEGGGFYGNSFNFFGF